MKLLPLLAIIFFIASSHVQANEILEIFSKCKANENPPKDDIVKISKGLEPEHKGGKCLLACVLEETGCMKDNKISQEMGTKWLEKMVGTDKSQTTKISQIIAACQDATNPDRCEAAFEILKCAKEQSKKLRLKSS